MRLPSQEKKTYPLWAKSLLSLIVLVFFAGGAWFFQSQQKYQRRSVEESLWSIANLKCQQISDWRAERMGDASVLMERLSLEASIRRYLSGDDEEAAEILRRLRPVKERYHYDDILLVDARKEMRLGLELKKEEAYEGYFEAFDAAAAEHRPVWSKIHIGGERPTPHLCIVVPFFVEDAGTDPMGALVLVSDAAQFLYPLIQSWPTRSDTAETLLVCRDGEEVLFLNELRHRKDTALKLRIPMSRSDLPAARALAGETGIVEGKDYRGVMVVAAILPVPYSPWFMVSKMDASEAFAEWRFRSAMILVFLFGGLGLVAAVWFLIGQRNLKAYYQRLYQSEAELSQVLGEYRFLAENTLDAIWTINRDMEFTYVNPAIKKHMGYDPSEWVGSPLRQHCSPEQYAKMTDLLDREIEKGKEHQGFTFEAEMLRKDGAPVFLEMHALVLFDEAGSLAGIQGTSRNITERIERERAMQQLQEELASARKMEAIGRLAGGVAHDYNNMLNIIIGYAELGMAGIAPEDPLYVNLSEIMKAAQRSAGITRKLLAFASKQMISDRDIDLNRHLEGMYDTLKQQLGDSIDWLWRPGSELWPVKMDPTQLGQILSSLCANARDAIDGQGRVTVETRNVSFDAAFCATHSGFVPGDFVMLSIGDNGRGMDRETLENVFEPFFTTKPFGESAGLGLAVVYGIVKQNNGFFDVRSEPGKGTTFRVYLPRRKA